LSSEAPVYVAGGSGMPAPGDLDDGYKWIALSNTTIGVLLSNIDASILLIAMPSIFRGIHLDPLQAGNSFYLLWMILGFLVVISVLVVSVGRLGDVYGRVRMYNLGFAVYTVASLILTVDPMSGRGGAMYLIIGRLLQGIGAAFLIGNAGAILTDAFPPNQRGLALGINNIAGISGTFMGLVLGGVLAQIDWRLVFLVSVPFGAFGTVWAHLKLRDTGRRQRAKVDWAGNLTFAGGLILVMIGITYGIEPADGKVMGWTSGPVMAELALGVAFLIAFAVIETKVEAPMFRLPLFLVRTFTFGTLSTFLSAISRGGLEFMLIIWFQGIWLPEHGYDFSRTPLHAGIDMLPLTAGFLLAGPVCGILSDRYGPRLFATGGMILAAVAFVLLLSQPVDFSYPEMALILLLEGIGMGMFAAPNRAGVMNSLPVGDRGAGGGMNATFQDSAEVLSIGIFFTLIIVGLASTLPHTLSAGLAAHGVPVATADRLSHLPPVTVLFAAFLGYNPIQTLLGPNVLGQLSAANRSTLTGKSFFPHLISAPFHTGLRQAFAFAFAAVGCVVAGAASWSRGRTYVDLGDSLVA
jgi:MFS family permease